MGIKSLAVTMGVGAAVGAVGILMLKQNNPARKLASQAAAKVENAAQRVTDKLTQKMNLQN